VIGVGNVICGLKKRVRLDEKKILNENNYLDTSISWGNSNDFSILFFAVL